MLDLAKAADLCRACALAGYPAADIQVRMAYDKSERGKCVGYVNAVNEKVYEHCIHEASALQRLVSKIVHKCCLCGWHPVSDLDRKRGELGYLLLCKLLNDELGGMFE